MTYQSISFALFFCEKKNTESQQHQPKYKHTHTEFWKFNKNPFRKCLRLEVENRRDKVLSLGQCPVCCDMCYLCVPLRGYAQANAWLYLNSVGWSMSIAYRYTHTHSRIYIPHLCAIALYGIGGRCRLSLL